MPDVTVTVKAGLSFACPRCGQMGRRAGPYTAVFAPPPGHEVASRDAPHVVRCYDGRSPFDWRLIFTDAEETVP